MDPFSVDIDLAKGMMLNPTHRTVRRASDMRGHYADAQALEALIDSGNDPVHYEVEEALVPEEAGQLMSCISRLLPGVVGDDEDPALRNPVDAVDLRAEVAAVKERGHGQRVAARFGVEAEWIVADLVRMGLDASDTGVEVLADDFFGESDDPIADGAGHLLEGGLPQNARSPPPSEWPTRVSFKSSPRSSSRSRPTMGCSFSVPSGYVACVISARTPGHS